MSAHEVIKAGEPTEMAGVAEAETQAAYAWALDYDDLNEFPTQRLTSRHITALGVAVSLVAIAVAGAVMLVVPSPKPSEPSEPVAITPAAVLDGSYRFDFNPMNDTIMGSPNPPSDTHPNSNPTTVWRAFRSACTPSGCTATETMLDDTNHQVAKAPLSTHQWRFTNGRWEELSEKSRETRETAGSTRQDRSRRRNRLVHSFIGAPAGRQFARFICCDRHIQ